KPSPASDAGLEATGRARQRRSARAGPSRLQRARAAQLAPYRLEQLQELVRRCSRAQQHQLAQIHAELSSADTRRVLVRLSIRSACTMNSERIAPRSGSLEALTASLLRALLRTTFKPFIGPPFPIGFQRALVRGM